MGNVLDANNTAILSCKNYIMEVLHNRLEEIAVEEDIQDHIILNFIEELRAGAYGTAYCDIHDYFRNHLNSLEKFIDLLNMAIKRSLDREDLDETYARALWIFRDNLIIYINAVKQNTPIDRHIFLSTVFTLLNETVLRCTNGAANTLHQHLLLNFEKLNLKKNEIFQLLERFDQEKYAPGISIIEIDTYFNNDIELFSVFRDLVSMSVAEIKGKKEVSEQDLEALYFFKDHLTTYVKWLKKKLEA